MSEQSLPSKITNTLVAVFTIVASLYGGYSFIEGKFEAFVAKKLVPYQQLLIAQSLVDDKAIDAYEKSLKGLIEQKVESDMLSAVVSPYLTSIANVDKPFKYQHHTENIKKLIGSKIAMDYDMANSLGWIYLQINQVEESRKYFLQSISLHKQDDLVELSSNAYDGLTVTYLVEGNLEKAIESYHLAWEYDYLNYNPQVYTVNNFGEFQWVKRLFSLYPNLQHNHQQMIVYLKNVYKLDKEIDRKELDKEALEQLVPRKST
ncbi:hypothetical protein [Vibrio vulnificus]|uniref:hypothetical protein n=1 Tax=Vibrio vulnificus TaxID=672 RepID=UPI000CD25CCF|nr:hypothetical protein [Vibrio vulnificus]POB87685.1 hypothetical protein CRN40_09365 [Vibrio vulnificus]